MTVSTITTTTKCWVAALTRRGCSNSRSRTSPVSSAARSHDCVLGKRQYSSSFPTPLAWWNPFVRTDSVRDSGATLASARSRSGTDADSPRSIQERKDATLALLALEFRSLSRQHPNKSRPELIDLAFDVLEAKDLDGKTTLQLRHELQSALEPQVVELFHAMRRVDESWSFAVDDSDDATGNAVLDRTLQLELERTIDELANTNPLQAEKGAHPSTYLSIRRAALETLIQRRETYKERRQNVTTTTQVAGGDEIDTSSSEASQPKSVSWVEADKFGYHETIDETRNEQIRHYQAINVCRVAKLRHDWGYAVLALQSSIAGAGRGVFVDGYAKAGSILAFQPGEVWSKEHLMSVSVDVERQLEKNDHYQMSLRPDDFMIDSRKSPYTVLTGNNTNMMALGHVINHPTPSNPPNARCIMLNFTQGMDLGPSLNHYIPNTYARPRNLTLMGGLWDRDAIDMHGMCLIATRDICNEEIFYDYRLATSRLPSWYHKMEDTAFVEEEEDSEKTHENGSLLSK